MSRERSSPQPYWETVYTRDEEAEKSRASDDTQLRAKAERGRGEWQESYGMRKGIGEIIKERE